MENNSVIFIKKTNYNTIFNVIHDCRSLLMHYLNCCSYFEEIPDRFCRFDSYMLNIEEERELIKLCNKYSPKYMKKNHFFICTYGVKPFNHINEWIELNDKNLFYLKENYFNLYIEVKDIQPDNSIVMFFNDYWLDFFYNFPYKQLIKILKRNNGINVEEELDDNLKCKRKTILWFLNLIMLILYCVNYIIQLYSFTFNEFLSDHYLSRYASLSSLTVLFIISFIGLFTIYCESKYIFIQTIIQLLFNIYTLIMCIYCLRIDDNYYSSFYISIGTVLINILFSITSYVLFGCRCFKLKEKRIL